MRRTLAALFAAAVAVAALALGVSSAAVAGENDCYTTFAPQSPQGGPMNHYYKNCGNQTLWVMPVYYQNGRTVALTAMCMKAPPERKLEWFYPTTVAGANYSTEVCDPYHPLAPRFLFLPPNQNINPDGWE